MPYKDRETQLAAQRVAMDRHSGEAELYEAEEELCVKLEGLIAD